MAIDTASSGRRMSAITAAAFMVCLMLVPASLAADPLVASLNATACAFPSIQAALDAAAPGDEVWVASGTYAESLQIDRPITVRAASPDCQTSASSGVVIDGSMNISGATASLVDLALTDTVGGAGAVVSVSSADVVLDHTRVSGGDAVGISIINGSRVTVEGGSAVEGNSDSGVSVVASDLIVVDSDVSANLGGGISVSDATVAVTGGAIRDNTRLGNGGGINATSSSTVTIIGTAFIDNTAADDGGLGTHGGAVSVDQSSLTMTGASLTGNRASSYGGNGGGLYLSDATAVLVNTSFVGNGAGGCSANGHICIGSGGGIFATGTTSVVIDADPATCDPDPSSWGGCSQFTRNSSPNNSGGAIDIEAGVTLEVAHTIFLDNLSMGAAIMARGATVTVENSLFVDSFWYPLWGYDSNFVVSSSTFAGTGSQLQFVRSSLTLRNSILTEAPRHSGTPYVFDSSCNDIQGVEPVGVGDINADPIFLDPWNGDFRLAAGSPAADQCPTGPPDDLTGAPRPVGSGFDMGAYERPVITDVTPPTWPVGSTLTAVGVLDRSLELAWTPAVDDVAVTTYWLYQDGEVIGVLPGSAGSLIVEGLDPYTSFHFSVQAHDAVGNRSSGDPELDVTTGRDVALFDPASGQWHLRYRDGYTVSFFYGVPGDTPLMGDWDCDGTDTVAMYRESTGFIYYRNTNNFGVADGSFFFGIPGDIPIAGDWNNNGCDTFGIYRNGKVFLRNTLDTGFADEEFFFGVPGDRPFAGDFTGDGVDTFGLYRQTSGLVHFTETIPAGDVATTDNQFFYGIPSDRIMADDWDLDGDDSVGIFRPSDQKFYLSYENMLGVADVIITFGQSTWLPAGGDLIPQNPGDSVICGDFTNWPDAKGWFDYYYHWYGDIANLDADGDLDPCESLH